MRTNFPHISVLSKPPQLPYGQTNQVFHENPVFSSFTNKCLDNLWLRSRAPWRPPIIDARSSMPNSSAKNMEVQCAAGGRHIAPTFPIIDAQSSMPNPSEKIWRCNVPPAGGTLHRLFQSSMPDHRCPIIDAQSIGKNMEVQCAAAGRHIAPTFPLIGTPTHRNAQ